MCIQKRKETERICFINRKLVIGLRYFPNERKEKKRKEKKERRQKRIKKKRTVEIYICV